jgi:predicted secreted protein
MAEITLRPDGSEDDAVALRAGDVLAVEVPENRTTGYVWSVAVLPEMLAELSPDAGLDPAAGFPTDSPRPGAPVPRVFRFAAQEPGVGELRLRSARPWEPAGGEEVAVAVRVEPAS